MTNDAAIRFARRVFSLAPIYGVVVLTPLYFAEAMFARMGRAPVTHPEYLYGFVGAALASQLLYWMIGRDPLRYRPIMPVAILAKLSFFVPVAILFAIGRLDGMTLGFALVDLAIALLFCTAWWRTRGLDRQANTTA